MHLSFSLLQSVQVSPSDAASLSGTIAQSGWILYLVAGLTIGALLVSISSLRQAIKFRGVVENFVARLTVIPALKPEMKRLGRENADLEKWRASKGLQSTAEADLAADLDHALVLVRDENRNERVFLRDSASTPWDERELAQRFVNVKLVSAAPGLLTAVGLVGTFIAIASGLSELAVGDNGQIGGVENLIRGLSGKFISSIAALLLAALVQVYELTLLSPMLRRTYHRLESTVEGTFPRISAAQQSAHMLDSLRQQEAALANISSDVVTSFGSLFSSTLLPDLSATLAKSVHSELGPSLARIDESLKELNDGIRRLESSKQESIGEELRALTSSLERSLTETLGQMGANFSKALSGGAEREFDNASEALRASASVLQGMNSSFEAMQATMSRLLQESERRAQDAFNDGEGRTRALNELVERLVSQLNESANTNVQEVQRLVVQAVAGMGEKLAKVSDELTKKSQEASEAQRRTSEELVNGVTAAAGRTNSETERLLAALAERSGDFIAAADQLRQLRDGVANVLSQTGERVREINEAAGHFRSVATEASTLTRSLRETQDQQRQSAQTASEAMVRLGNVVGMQSQVVDASGKTLTQAQAVMAQVDERMSSALRVLIERMQDYNTQVEKNFEIILTRVNQKLPELFARLEGSLTGVAEIVEELNDTVGRMNGKRS